MLQNVAEFFNQLTEDLLHPFKTVGLLKRVSNSLLASERCHSLSRGKRTRKGLSKDVLTGPTREQNLPDSMT